MSFYIINNFALKIKISSWMGSRPQPSLLLRCKLPLF